MTSQFMQLPYLQPYATCLLRNLDISHHSTIKKKFLKYIADITKQTAAKIGQSIKVTGTHKQCDLSSELLSHISETETDSLTPCVLNKIEMRKTSEARHLTTLVHTLHGGNGHNIISERGGRITP